MAPPAEFSTPSRTHGDVRMRGFVQRSTVDEALAWLDARIRSLAAESVTLSEASGRVLAEPICATIEVPGFDRAMMDGYAIRAADVEGASSYNPMQLDVIGQSMPGAAFEGRLARRQAVRIMTGAPLPAGADAVLPVEKTQLNSDRLLALDEVPPGKHVGRRGEDVAVGDAILPAGRRLRPQDLGLLSSVAADRVNVVRKPRVRLVVTGAELVPAGTSPSPHRIADANGPMLEALVRRDGGVPVNPGIVADDSEAILSAMRSDADVVIVSGGSSVGQEDHAPALLAAHGKLAVHGIAMRPSSPAGLGVLDGRLVFLLPGNPVSCLCAYDFFAGRAVRGLGGRSLEWPYPPKVVRLVRKLSSVIGRVDYARVRLVDGGAEPLAIGGASLLSSTTVAEGFVVVPADSEGYPDGAEVTLNLYDPPA